MNKPKYLEAEFFTLRFETVNGFEEVVNLRLLACENIAEIVNRLTQQVRVTIIPQAREL